MVPTHGTCKWCGLGQKALYKCRPVDPVLCTIVVDDFLDSFIVVRLFIFRRPGRILLGLRPNRKSNYRCTPSAEDAKNASMFFPLFTFHLSYEADKKYQDKGNRFSIKKSL